MKTGVRTAEVHETTGPGLRLAAAISAAFFVSLCVMAVEVAAGRIVSKDIGASLYTWTSVIGVVLAGLTLGNAVGGRLSDRFRPRRMLPFLFLLSSLSCLMIPVLAASVRDLTVLWSLPGPMRIVVRVVIVFMLPVTVMGMVAPVAAKMALDLGRARGRTVGDVYAWANVGSIVGTFLSGFWLIAWVGMMGVVWVMAGVLAILTVAYAWRRWWAYAWMAAFACLAAVGTGPWPWAEVVGTTLRIRQRPSPGVIYEAESQYSYISVLASSDNTDERQMLLDKLVHSQMNLRAQDDLKYDYEKIYAAMIWRFLGDRENLRTLTVGGGGYVFPRYLTSHWPNGQTEVVEIDSAVTKAAIAAFGLSADSPIVIHHMDGRNLIETLARRKGGGAVPAYDVICGDAFNDCNVPFHLTTLEYNRMIAELLSPDGLYLINLIDMFESGRFLGAVVNTFEKVFRHVYVIVPGLLQPDARTTFIVAGTRRALDLTDLGRRPEDRLRFPCIVLDRRQMTHLESADRRQVLSDDFAPVENMLASVVRSTVLHPKVELGRQAIKLMSAGRREEAASLFRRALELDPRLVDARLKLVEVLAALGRTNEVEGVIRAGLSVDPNNVALLRTLGVRLVEGKRWAEAEPCFRRILSLAPDTWPDHYLLGKSLMELGQEEAGAAEIDAAVQADQKGEGSHQEIGIYWLGRGRFARAVEVFRKGLAVKPDNPDITNSLAWVLATCPEASLRNGAEAVRLMEKVNARTGGRNPRALDTLAAAYAEAGRFADAVTTAEKAITEARSAGIEDVAANYEARLALYRKGQPYHEPAATK